MITYRLAIMEVNNEAKYPTVEEGIARAEALLAVAKAHAAEGEDDEELRKLRKVWPKWDQE